MKRNDTFLQLLLGKLEDSGIQVIWRGAKDFLLVGAGKALMFCILDRTLFNVSGKALSKDSLYIRVEPDEYEPMLQISKGSGTSFEDLMTCLEALDDPEKFYEEATRVSLESDPA